LSASDMPWNLAICVNTSLALTVVVSSWAPQVQDFA
jgi:hypothetical protein